MLSLRFAVPLAVCSGASAYVWSHLDRGWWPHDEGTLAEPAARVLQGQIPHRDFVDAYTGGLTYLHALAFWVFGEQLTSLRLVLFAFFVAWVPALWYIVSRFLPPLDAGAVVLLAVVWSVPNYTASMPSWYNTFFATFGTAAFLRHLETDRRRWLFAAGLCAGASILIKIVGVYFLLAGLMYLVFKEQSLRRPDSAATRTRLSAYSIVASVFGLAVTGFGFALTRGRLDGPVVVNFAVPILALGVFVIWSERLTCGADRRARTRAFLRLAAPFFLGGLVPLILFTLPYAATGAVGQLVHGVLVVPMRRVASAALVPPTLWTAIALVPFTLLLWLGRNFEERPRSVRVVAALALVCLALADVVGTRSDLLYFLTWQSLRAIVPLLTVGGLVVVASRGRRKALKSVDAQRLVLLIAVTAMCSLVQFPFAAPVYFSYVAPLVIVATVATTVYGNLVPRFALRILIVFYLAFGVIRLNPGLVVDLGYRVAMSDSTHRLALARGGLYVRAPAQAQYERLVSLMRRHAGGSHYIYAGPDSPQVYFLTGLANPTRTLFEFLDQPKLTEPQLLRILRERDVNVVAINRYPPFSGRMPESLRRALELRYRSVAIVGRFLVRWRT